MMGLSGGPANHGHDGWLTYECSVGNGIMVLDSIEVDEAMYPMLVEERRIVEDSMGAGRWNGAPAVGGTYRSLQGDIVVAYVGDGGTFPAKGVLGGDAGANCGTWKRHPDGRVERLPDFHQETYKFGEAVVYRGCAGGGYGAPRSRDPERVAEDVNSQVAFASEGARNLWCRRPNPSERRRCRDRLGGDAPAQSLNCQNHRSRQPAKPAVHQGGDDHATDFKAAGLGGHRRPGPHCLGHARRESRGHHHRRGYRAERRHRAL